MLEMAIEFSKRSAKIVTQLRINIETRFKKYKIKGFNIVKALVVYY